MNPKRTCENHNTPSMGYLDAHEWAEKMAITHQQVQCQECGLFLIWEERPDLLSTSDVKALIQQNISTLARWYCQLNEWEWPDEIPTPEPTDRTYRPGSRREKIMEWIERDIGRKECLREHWKRHGIETPGESFDDWYEKRVALCAIE